MTSLALREGQSRAVDALKLAGTSDAAKRLAHQLSDGLRLFELKELCQRLGIKVGKANKSTLVQRLLAYGELGLLEKGRLDSQEAAKVVSYLSDDVKGALDRLPPFESGDLSGLWSKKLSGVLQSLTYTQIYTYLVELRAKSDDDRQRQSFKSMKGYSYFASGWVENVWLCRPHDAFTSSSSVGSSQAEPAPALAERSMLFSKGYVFQSYPSREKHAYSVFVCLDATGRIYTAKCPCAAGLGESCSHIAALLFFLLDCCEKHLEKLPESVTCTGRAMTWNQPPPHKDIQPVPVSDMVFSKAEYGKASRSISGGALDDFDPRCIDDRQIDHDDLQALLQATQSSFPQSSLLQFHGVAPSAQDRCSKQVETEEQVRELIVPRAGHAVQDDTDRLDNVEELMCADFVADQVISDVLSARIESLTVDQTQSPLWHDLHVGRLTSSIFHDVLVRRASTSPDALVKRVMGYFSSVSTAAMQWGIQQEASAIQDYVSYMRSNGHPELEHKPSGLTLLPSRSMLGASADGEVTDPSADNPRGVLEVKCPSRCQNKSIRYMTPEEITEAFPQEACLKLTADGKLQLKRTHRYYTQVQGELGVKHCKWADFVVWTAAKSQNLFVERILFDESFWDKLLAALLEFYESFVAPEILFRRMQLAQTSSVTQPSMLALLPDPQRLETARAPGTGGKEANSSTLAPELEKCCSKCSWPQSLSLRQCTRCKHKFHHLCTTDDEGKKCRCCCLPSSAV